MLSFPNATITIKETSPTPTGFDEFTGAPIFSPPSIKAIPAFLESKKDPQEFNLPGDKNVLAYLEGRTDGKPPESFKVNTYYPITINLQNETKTGNFYLVTTTKGGMGLESFFGTSIKGYLVD